MACLVANCVNTLEETATMIVTKCVIQFTTHHACISVDDQGVINVFKYTNRSCDFDVFDSEDSFGASDYILMPPNNCHYYVTIPGETPPHLIP